jgi:large subunit ribosomal protein L17
MRHQKKHKIFGRPKAQRDALADLLCTAFLEHERIQTTQEKAKWIQPKIEQMITLGKENTLHHRRQLFQILRDERLVKKVVSEISPRYATRPGGYTRVVKIRQRKTDGANVVQLELVS